MGAEGVADAVERRDGIARHHRHIAPVHDRQLLEHVDPQLGIVGSKENGVGPNGLRSEARPGSVGRRRVEGDTQARHVDTFQILDVGNPGEGPDAHIPGSWTRRRRPVPR